MSQHNDEEIESFEPDDAVDNRPGLDEDLDVDGDDRPGNAAVAQDHISFVPMDFMGGFHIHTRSWPYRATSRRGALWAIQGQVAVALQLRLSGQAPPALAAWPPSLAMGDDTQNLFGFLQSAVGDPDHRGISLDLTLENRAVSKPIQ